MSDNEMQELKDAIVNLTHQIERMAEKQETMYQDVRQIKDGKDCLDFWIIYRRSCFKDNL